MPEDYWIDTATDQEIVEKFTRECDKRAASIYAFRVIVRGLSKRLHKILLDGLFYSLTVKPLLKELVDDEDCRYDHHGYCQSHCLAERPCPQERLKKIIG